jgi:hypothetical protein
VGTTATPLTGFPGERYPGFSVMVYNPGPVEVVVGNASVTVSTGLSLPSGATFGADLDDDETLYGVVASGSQIVHYLQSGV